MDSNPIHIQNGYSPFVQQWNLTWASPFGYQYDRFSDVALDGNNTIYLGGYTSDMLTGGDYDIVLVKYNSTGHQLWEQIWGGVNNDYCYSISVDRNHSILLAGKTESFGSGMEDAFLVKYAPNGSRLWYQTWGGINDDYATDIIVDDNASIFIVGTTNSSGSGNDDAFIVKFNSTGHQQWNRTWNQADFDWADGITLDKSNNIYITGRTFIMWDFKKVFIVKYDSLGNQIWNATFAKTNYDLRGYNIVVDSNYYCYVAGVEEYGLMPYDLLIKLYPNGTQLWNQTYSSSFRCSDVILSGQYLFTAGTTKAAVRWYDVNGIHFWTEIYDTFLVNSGTSLAKYKSSFYLVGYLSASTPFIVKYTLVDNDTDADLILDGWELLNSLDPTNATDAALDFDFDNLSNLEEFQNNLDPNDADTDNDSLTDYHELYTYGTYPTDSDTDNDGLPDGWEVANSLNPLMPFDVLTDSDQDALTNGEEYNLGLDPNNPDSDNDGLQDGAEYKVYNTDPSDPDTDDDGFSDGLEILLGGNPLDPLNPLIGLIILCIEVVSGIVLTIFIIKILKKKT